MAADPSLLDASASLSPDTVILTNNRNVLEVSISPDTAHLRPSSLLMDFVRPLALPSFLSSIYRTRCFLIHGGGLDRLRALTVGDLFDLNLRDLLTHSLSDRIFAWSKAAGASIVSIELESPDAALACYEGGASLCFRAPLRFLHGRVLPLTHQLRMGFGAVHVDGEPRVEGEMFAARRGHVTDWHFDYMDNFTIHLKGRKKWTLKQGAIKHPIRGASSHYKGVDSLEKQSAIHSMQDPSFVVRPPDEWLAVDATDVTLGPGDLFYHNAGVWHRVETLEDSLSINISLVGMRWADVAASAVKHILWKAPLMRSVFTAGDSVVSSAIMEMQRLIGLIQPQDLVPLGLLRRGVSPPLDWSQGLDEVPPEALSTFKPQLLPQSMLRLNPLASLTPVSPPSVGEQTLKYSLQLSFGNDDLEPLHSVIITVLPAVGPVVYRLAQLLTQDAPVTARLQDILESSPVSVMSVTDIPAFDMIGDALCVMAYHGLFSFTPKPA